MLTNDQIDSFNRNGFLIIEKFFDPFTHDIDSSDLRSIGHYTVPRRTRDWRRRK
jgi:hypothetical protein